MALVGGAIVQQWSVYLYIVWCEKNILMNGGGEGNFELTTIMLNEQVLEEQWKRLLVTFMVNYVFSTNMTTSNAYYCPMSGPTTSQYSMLKQLEEVENKVEYSFHQKPNLQKNSTFNEIDIFFCTYQTLQALFHLIFFFFFFYPFEDAMVSQDNSKLSRWMKMVGRKDDEWPLPLLSLDLFIKRYGSRFDFPPVLHRWYTFEHLEEEELLVCCAAGSNTTSAAFSQPPASMPFSSP